ncbi:MAG: cytochrome c [Candidatus Sericytochromatia bacterium]|nr:cytochrome c [Candidatus Tanganyikabacteria bacterium]
MKRLGLTAGLTLAALSVGCAFFGYSGVAPTPATPTPTPTPTASPSPTPVPGATPTPTPDPARVAAGKALYDSKCAMCHPSSSPKKNITRTRLDGAITGNVGNMGSLSTLTDPERDDIVTYTKTL